MSKQRPVAIGDEGIINADGYGFTKGTPVTVERLETLAAEAGVRHKKGGFTWVKIKDLQVTVHKLPKNRRAYQIERLHDEQAVKDGQFRAVGNSAPVWINLIEITEELQDKNWVFVKEKLIRYWRVNVPVGESIMGVPVTQVDPEWIKREREILS